MYNSDNPSQHSGISDHQIFWLILSCSAFTFSLFAFASSLLLCSKFKRCERKIKASSKAFYLSEQEGREAGRRVLQIIQDTNSKLTELQSDIEQLKVTADLLINQAAKQRKNGSKHQKS